ncbi:hypothetical protein [Sphingopyxis sp. P8]|uniref:hypothetical protein n=1 Tax=Sphingopyxis sp. P8 TaxID=2763256 RepID=UPI001D0A6F3A|nr:hypothetical protein [Sphingopyxis sp. P8]
MKDQTLAATRLGRFDDWTEDEIAYLIHELGRGMGRDATDRFDGYWGAYTALSIAGAFVTHGDTPMANELAVAWMGALAAYALDSTYWGNENAPVTPGDCDPVHATAVCALSIIQHAARPVQHDHGLEGHHPGDPRPAA